MLYNDLHNSYSSPNIIVAFEPRRKRWRGLVARMETMRNVHNILARKSEGRIPLGRS
jgi:hypothetical protein